MLNAPPAASRHVRRPRVSLTAQAVGIALLGAVGGWVLVSGHVLGAAFHSNLRPAFGIDRLSGFFLVVIASVGLPATVFARDALEDDEITRDSALAS